MVYYFNKKEVCDEGRRMAYSTVEYNTFLDGNKADIVL